MVWEVGVNGGGVVECEEVASDGESEREESVLGGHPGVKISDAVSPLFFGEGMRTLEDVVYVFR